MSWRQKDICFVLCASSSSSTATLDSFSFFLPFVAPFNYSNLFVSTLCLDILKRECVGVCVFVSMCVRVSVFVVCA